MSRIFNYEYQSIYKQNKYKYLYQLKRIYIIMAMHLPKNFEVLSR